MSTEKHPIGSPGWVNHVFSTPPVRALKGRSKMTQYHDMQSRHVYKQVGGQGRNEMHCALLLEYLANQGLIRKFKEQPFRTSAIEFGYEIVPDYLAIGRDDEIYVIEAKSARYLTAEVESTFARNRAKFLESNINHLVWTDRHPLNKHVRHTLLEMRRQISCVPGEEIATLKQHLGKSGFASFQELVNDGYDLGIVFAASWAGKCHFKFTEEFHPETRISVSHELDLRRIFLTSNGTGTGWWNELPNR